MSDSKQTPSTAAPPEVVMHSRGYLGLLLFAGLIGVPLSLAAFGFLVAVHELEHLVWDLLPDAMGYDTLPAWWPLWTLSLAGLIVGLTVRHLPGHGGHVPAMGLAPEPSPPSALPGVILAAAASLVLGAVVGPEAPLIAIGSGLALLAVHRVSALKGAETSAVVAAAGSAAAISAIFGNPLIAAVLFLEVLGMGRRQAMLLVLPCLMSSGVGALVFTGLGRWSGLEIGALAIPDLPHSQLAVADVLWAVPIAVVVAVGIWAVFVVGRRTSEWASIWTLRVTLGAALVAGASAAVYSLATDHSPAEVALSGQAALGLLATNPGAWSTGALVLLLLCKGLAYAVCLGAFRGGPIFPAVFLGAAFGVLANAVLPGTGLVPCLAAGMAAGASVIGLPVTGAVLVVLILGDAASSQMPVVILAIVAATILHGKVGSDTEPAPA
jgi:H+/Cl- antiporter ClcA